MPRRAQLASLLTGRWAIATLVWVLLLGLPQRASAKTFEEYRHFRALSVDLLGRPPTQKELAAFARSDFNLDHWLDDRIKEPGYVDRLVRVYLDLLRLEVGPAVNFAPPLTTLHRQLILGPDGKPLYLYYRHNQRRARPETDGEFCLTAEESGVQLLPNNQVKGEPTPVPSAILDANTTLVRPWWLYRDYREVAPTQLYRKSWPSPDPLYQPVEELLLEPDKQPAIDIRVCKEEAQTTAEGHIYVTGRKAPPPAMVPGSPPVPPPTPPLGRPRPLPLDDGYAKAHPDEPISCHSALSLTMSIDCGCGPGLEYCTPGIDGGNDPRAFAFPNRTPLGLDQPIDNVPQNVSAWHKLWWAQEAVHLLTYLFAGDRDFREILTGRYSLVNGPLVQFYRAIAPASCCGREKAFGMTQETEPLFDSKALPNLLPWDVGTWRLVADRGSHAAGILTTPAFLMKFASRRARAALLYNAFLCKSFVAGNQQLVPSTEPNLMIRPGCATCHATLEPLAAYFSRGRGDPVDLPAGLAVPAAQLSVQAQRGGQAAGILREPSTTRHFPMTTAGLLRGAYASIEHAAAGPIGAGSTVANSPEFAQCAVERVTSSFLGRPLNSDDEAMVKALTSEFVNQGFRMRSLVRAIVKSPLYQRANNLRSVPR